MILPDPACGSGNFLTETYHSLHKLEDDVLASNNAKDYPFIGVRILKAGELLKSPHQSAARETSIKAALFCHAPVLNSRQRVEQVGSGV